MSILAIRSQFDSKSPLLTGSQHKSSLHYRCRDSVNLMSHYYQCYESSGHQFLPHKSSFYLLSELQFTLRPRRTKHLVFIVKRISWNNLPVDIFSHDANPCNNCQANVYSRGKKRHSRNWRSNVTSVG